MNLIIQYFRRMFCKHKFKKEVRTITCFDNEAYRNLIFTDWNSTIEQKLEMCTGRYERWIYSCPKCFFVRIVNIR